MGKLYSCMKRTSRNPGRDQSDDHRQRTSVGASPTQAVNIRGGIVGNVGNIHGDQHNIINEGVDPSKKRLKDLKVEEKSQEQNKKHFGTDDTVALLLSGVGQSDLQKKNFKQNLEDVKKMLTDHLNIRSDRIKSVVYTPGKTKNELLKKFEEMQEQKTEIGNFLFYYLGHNSPNNQSLKIDDRGININCYISYKDLQECLTEIIAPNKLFIIDTCYCGEVALDEEDVFPFLWDTTLGQEDEINKLQWSSSQDEKAYFNPAGKIGFTSAIREVLSDATCTKNNCQILRSDFSECFVPINRLHKCVRDHVSAQGNSQHPHMDFNQGNENMHLFPLIAKLN